MDLAVRHIQSIAVGMAMERPGRHPLCISCPARNVLSNSGEEFTDLAEGTTDEQGDLRHMFCPMKTKLAGV